MTPVHKIYVVLSWTWKKFKQIILQIQLKCSEYMYFLSDMYT